MQKTLYLFIILLSSLSSFSQIDNKTFTIKAFLPYWNGASVNIIVEGKRSSSGFIQKDMYSFSGNLEQQKTATLEIKKNNKTVFVPFILEPGTIRIIDKGNNFFEAIGTASNDSYFQIKNAIDSQSVLLKDVSLTEIKSYKRKIAAEYIRNNSNSLVSLQLMNEHYYLDNAVDDTSYFILFDGLDKSLKQTVLGKKLEKEAQISRWTALGVIAPNLTLTDVNNKLSSIYEKGTYTLIDFWASWCIPCKKEIPAMVSLFNKYKEKNFQIVSFSLDTDVSKLKKAIEKDKLDWKHLIDYKAWGSEVVKMFGVKTIPMNFLLDENGTIIAKNLSPEALDAKLAQLILKEF